MKILIDMNLSPSWVGFPSEAGFDPVHWSAVRAMTAPDTDLTEGALVSVDGARARLRILPLRR
jgi:predicted nuclease of predicted toxin-antitoxin system